MFVELVYDKRNVDGLVGAREIILAELTKRVHQIFPDAEVKVKPICGWFLYSHQYARLGSNTVRYFGKVISWASILSHIGGSLYTL